MTLPVDVFEAVRQRARYACEYCGVTETDSGGALTVDHIHPQSRGGSDDLSNLAYCCFRCNLYKSDYWPDSPDDEEIWNPRQEYANTHCVELADGSLYPVTSMGEFTVKRLKLNRRDLIEFRMKRRPETISRQLFEQNQNILQALELIGKQVTWLVDSQKVMLENLRGLLQAEESRLDE